VLLLCWLRYIIRKFGTDLKKITSLA